MTDQLNHLRQRFGHLLVLVFWGHVPLLGVTALLTEAKRALVFTGQPIHEISYDLGFADPSHFARFFRKQTGTTPQAFREGRGG